MAEKPEPSVCMACTWRITSRRTRHPKGEGKFSAARRNSLIVHWLWRHVRAAPVRLHRRLDVITTPRHPDAASGAAHDAGEGVSVPLEAQRCAPYRGQAVPT